MSAQAAPIPGDTLLEELIAPARSAHPHGHTPCSHPPEKSPSSQPRRGQSSGVNAAILSCVRSSMGVELLRKMGWKEGQGVGPRVKRRARHGGRSAPGREWRSEAVMFGKPASVP